MSVCQYLKNKLFSPLHPMPTCVILRLRKDTEMKDIDYKDTKDIDIPSKYAGCILDNIEQDNIEQLIKWLKELNINKEDANIVITYTINILWD
jgi:hypothetical protein